MIECCYSLRLFSWPQVSCENNSVRFSFYLVKLLVNLKMAILEFSRPEKADFGLHVCTMFCVEIYTNMKHNEVGHCRVLTA